MAALTDAVRFFFPAAPIGKHASPEYPLYTRDESPVKRFKSLQKDDDEHGRVKISLRTVIISYAPDWILALLLWGVLAILNRSGGHKREFSLTDTTIQHSHAIHERVPPNLLAFISVGIPLLVLVPISLFVSRNGWDVHNSVLGLVMSYTMTGVVTQVVKMSVGRPRPDLIARCLPAPGSVDHPVFGLSTIDICTNTNLLVLNDGFKSFPSGHSSLSFAGLGFLSLYLAGKMHLGDVRGHRTRAWFALSPLLGGTMVAISRTEDNRHHWQDVLVGSLLGLSIAWVSYRTYYPRMSHKQCHLPLAPRCDPDPETHDDLDDAEEGRNRRDGVRLLETDDERRGSEEEVAWRRD
ncbi:uncharacterized protein I303_107765 [Kwoniella dejecticola CBS 10117]|uniref:PAP2 domain-containing protein n=1 Tax=Kwoniella dejecticola CBS 10117 TaxID=1296121 RepID=A0A1A5ZVM9_9TREE|nr:PAP2 domain-containing protein [Kwoniella dejecticola CBS 10117]OBR81860.1 PAP2 domain-containing protein [Kwoniella dejecticola CBS 10117]